MRPDPIEAARALTRPPLQLVDGEADRIAPVDRVAADQVHAAKQALTRNTGGAPRWPWTDLNELTGPMLPGELHVVGALRGNGKSALLMSLLDAFGDIQTPTLYLPLEIDPEQCRRRWAAWKLGLDVRAVIRGEWAAVGGQQAQNAVAAILEEQQARYPHINFAPPKRITLPKLVNWCRWAQREYDARVVMIDHLHRMDTGGDGGNHRLAITDVVRQLKDLARELGLVLIAAAQLNRSSDPLDAFTPPVLSRLKETAAIEEEADVVLMLSRRLRRDLPDDFREQLRMGRITERELADHGTMVVTCRKHRLDDDAFNGRVILRVENGRVVEWRAA
jgi:replicative DNA helicase